MIPLTNHDFQWGRSEVVIIYPGDMQKSTKQPTVLQPKWLTTVAQVAQI